MVAGTQLSSKPVVETMPLSVTRDEGRMGPVGWIIATFRAAMEKRVPVGYEDEAGFHYGGDGTGWFFSI